MNRFIPFASLLVAAAFAGHLRAEEPSTRPAPPPDRPLVEHPAVEARWAASTSQPAPATRPSFGRGILERVRSAPSPNARVAYVDLDRPVVEAPASFAFFADTSLTLQSIVERLRQARSDRDLRAVLLNFGSTSLNLAQAQELRDALVELRKAGKRTFVYADSYGTAEYIAASGSRDICLMSGGELVIPGIGLEAMFARELLDKIGVKADYVQIGQYKGADEPFTRTAPSEEMRGELDKILDSLYAEIVDGISHHRNLPRTEVVEMINNVYLPARLAKERQFVDHLVDQDGLRDLLKRELGRDIELIHNYGVPERDEIDFSNPFSMLSLFSGGNPPPATRPSVAVVYAEGVIVDGEASESIFGNTGQIGSGDIRRAMRIASRDPMVKAIVLRIDSPGGSASASEVMWQAVRRAAQDKPLVVSIGGMAASGGYYVACAGDQVFADSAALVGSIGVLGGKLVIEELFAKVGLHTESFTRGGNADLFTWSRPFTDSQRRLITNWMQQTYDQFTDRILTGRKDRIRDIHEVAHGRIFVARQARELGLVDELGGIEAAIAHAAARANLAEGSYDIRTLPPTRTIVDLLRGGGSEAAAPLKPAPRSAIDVFLTPLAPSLRQPVRRQLQVMYLLQERPVLLVSPYTVTVR
jgi:protease-4